MRGGGKYGNVSGNPGRRLGHGQRGGRGGGYDLSEEEKRKREKAARRKADKQHEQPALKRRKKQPARPESRAEKRSGSAVEFGPEMELRKIRSDAARKGPYIPTPTPSPVAPVQSAHSVQQMHRDETNEKSGNITDGSHVMTSAFDTIRPPSAVPWEAGLGLDVAEGGITQAQEEDPVDLGIDLHQATLSPVEEGLPGLERSTPPAILQEAPSTVPTTSIDTINRHNDPVHQQNVQRLSNLENQLDSFGDEPHDNDMGFAHTTGTSMGELEGAGDVPQHERVDAAREDIAQAFGGTGFTAPEMAQRQMKVEPPAVAPPGRTHPKEEVQRKIKRDMRIGRADVRAALAQKGRLGGVVATRRETISDLEEDRLAKQEQDLAAGDQQYKLPGADDDIRERFGGTGFLSGETARRNFAQANEAHHGTVPSQAPHAQPPQSFARQAAATQNVHNQLSNRPDSAEGRRLTIAAERRDYKRRKAAVLTGMRQARENEILGQAEATDEDLSAQLNRFGGFGAAQTDKSAADVQRDLYVDASTRYLDLVDLGPEDTRGFQARTGRPRNYPDPTAPGNDQWPRRTPGGTLVGAHTAYERRNRRTPGGGPHHRLSGREGLPGGDEKQAPAADLETQFAGLSTGLTSDDIAAARRSPQGGVAPPAAEQKQQDFSTQAMTSRAVEWQIQSLDRQMRQNPRNVGIVLNHTRQQLRQMDHDLQIATYDNYEQQQAEQNRERMAQFYRDVEEFQRWVDKQRPERPLKSALRPPKSPKMVSPTTFSRMSGVVPPRTPDLTPPPGPVRPAPTRPERPTGLTPAMRALQLQSRRQRPETTGLPDPPRLAQNRPVGFQPVRPVAQPIARVSEAPPAVRFAAPPAGVQPPRYGGGGGGPIIVAPPGVGGTVGGAVGGQGGQGGQSSSAAAGQQAAAKKAAAKKAAPKKKAGQKQTGVTAARKKYTAKRKQKLAELRSAKAKRIREFNSKTKKMPAAERKRRRSEFKKKVNAQFKNIVSKFPTARGITSVAQLLRLIKQAESIRA